MEMIFVESSAMEAIGYDSNSAVLRIQFTDSVYEYYDVPQYVYDELLSADSKGAYANKNIYKQYAQQRL
ncbi:KTSC domain-containing protein [Fulvivirga ligni]|uniref:KTSC domain-containing protein n=1 Tax=Fulvivirga ligni TaxID=2904246 RepID=UPI001F41A805|nr:KTSC domain-containing protein [Fulvivirga ligni]UII19390.1 KTSC domain-containing protein [Fulvivirga ligni]